MYMLIYDIHLFLKIRRPPRATRTDTLFPYTTLFRSSLDKADGTNVVPEQTVELASDYVSVPTRSTGTEGERELLAREMQKEMTASILRRIDAASRAPQPIGMPSAPPPVDEAAPRSEERRVGKECVSTCRSRWSPYH